MLIWPECLRQRVDAPRVIWPQKNHAGKPGCSLLDGTCSFILGIIVSTLHENSWLCLERFTQTSGQNLDLGIARRNASSDGICLALSLAFGSISAISPLLSTLWFLNSSSLHWSVADNFLSFWTNRLSKIKVKSLPDYCSQSDVSSVGKAIQVKMVFMWSSWI